LFFALLVLSFELAFAAGIVPCGGEGNPCTICHFFQGVSNIINFLLESIAFPLSIVAFLYGGFMLIISGGSEDKRKKGKTAIYLALWGLIFSFAGWLIVDTILKGLLAGAGGQIQDWGPWNKIPTCP
jgi:hypothetical protein